MNQPDIEIYIKQASPEVIQNWFSNVLENSRTPSNLEDRLNSNQQCKFNILVGDHEVPVCITPSAAGKAFTSIWFQSDKTPWQNDLECAESFTQLFENEVRCSAESWNEAEEENSEKWWSLTQNEKRLIRWG